MFKLIYFILIVLFFNACSITKYNYLNNYIDITKEKKYFTNDMCSTNSYLVKSRSIEYGDIFIEHINLDTSCQWNGLPRSFFDDLFKQKNHIKSMRILERIDLENFEFNTYLINDKYILNLIYYFSSFEDTFIVDYKGVLFTKIIKSFDKNYVNRYLSKQRYSSKYNSSLVNNNIIGNYFSKEIEFSDK